MSLHFLQFWSDVACRQNPLEGLIDVLIDSLLGAIQIDAVGWKCACTHLSVSSADFSLTFENSVKNNAKMSFHNSTTDANCSKKGRATIYVSVAIMELFKINRCFGFVFLHIFNIPRKSLFRFCQKQH